MNSLLVILLGALGDVARGVSVLAPIKATYPGCRISWLVEPKSEGLVRLHPLVDEVIVYERKKGVPEAFALGRRLRARRFDAVLDLQRHLKSGFFSFSTGAPRRVGFHRTDSKEFNWLFNTDHIGPEPKNLSKVLHFGRFLPKLGVAEPADPDFGFGGLDLEPHVPAPLRSAGRGVVGLVMGSSWVSKNWPAAGYLRVASGLLAKGVPAVVLMGDRTQEEAAGKLEAALADPRVVNLVNRTSLAELLAAISRCSACAGPDSGPGHIAAALGVPYVGVFGPTNPERVAPFRNEAFAVRTPVGCRGCMRRVCPGVGNVCMKLIDPDAVLAKIVGAL